VWQATWKPWGEPQAISGTKALNLRFPGQYFQIETGYHHNWHRHYDPTTGRYTQPDPLGFVDGPSVYAYATNSPFMRTDREGLEMYPNNFVGPLPPNGWREKEGTKTSCGLIPPAPSGADVEANIKDVKSRTWYLNQPVWWYNQVRNKGPWDYKQLGSKYQDFGNFNYGATGRALPLPSSILLRGAGWANTQAQSSRQSKWGNWYDRKGSYGDDPADQEWVKKGISYCSCGAK
jgi:RHS repeat-associated protein